MGLGPASGVSLRSRKGDSLDALLGRYQGKDGRTGHGDPPCVEVGEWWEESRY